ncbi:methionine ABC transporter ATP-binding protein [Candidatus Berkiella cookevillensis]|uniref:Methionine ABC transporter ATP-binding protein n=1 Tax=Candidatus Berkiella cookevillensis TaxID=437022 RepID=A0A0Q9YRW1_9GAMM|nr:methionine ABC transporter ATP-binding protein [Candidatus Berkiella cookevillensis]MCS5708237.1 methionine ABC transporter ATP-binding protein [Candidatus Berkiella cookevillensis]
MISIKNLSKSYSSGIPKPSDPQAVKALDNINLDIKPGEVFGIIGKSGAGKSTLIKCVNLLSPPSSGDVIIDGQPTSHLTENELRITRLKMGKIFQHFNLLRSRTVEQNIALPLELLKKPKTEIRKRVTDLLMLVNLSEHAKKYPSQLSGGQKQRVAIARAIATTPKILLSDEATSALDPTSTRDILRLLKKINQELGLTIFMITHEMDVVKEICDKVAVIDDGKIIEQGSVIEIFTNPKQEITKELVKKTSMLEVPLHIQKMLQKYSKPGSSRILRLAYHGEQASQPIISYLISQYRIVINILQGYIENIQDQPMGVMIVEIRGDQDNIEKSIQFLERNRLYVETLGYVESDH